MVCLLTLLENCCHVCFVPSLSVFRDDVPKVTPERKTGIHGGGPVDASFPMREALIIRYFGDDMHYSPDMIRFKMRDDPKYKGLKEGDHFSLVGAQGEEDQGGPEKGFPQPLFPLVSGPGLKSSSFGAARL